MTHSFGIDEAHDLLGRAFAPWVQALGLRAEGFDAEGGDFILPASDALYRVAPGSSPILCGQAIAAAADTVSVLALAALNGRYRNLTTVDLTCHFLRPLGGGDTAIRLTALSNGRRMATTRAEFRQGTGGKLGATVTCAFAYLED